MRLKFEQQIYRLNFSVESVENNRRGFPPCLPITGDDKAVLDCREPADAVRKLQTRFDRARKYRLEEMIADGLLKVL
jgi:hypothetical protein